MSEQATGPTFLIEKLYVKDLSVEVPNAPEIFLMNDEQSVELQLRTDGKALGDGLFEVGLTVTATATIGEKTAFLVEVTQAGIFQLHNIPEEALESLLAIACPNLLYPYAREVVSSATTRAGFPPVVLQPVNFEQLYLERRAQQAATAPAHELPIQ